MQIDLHHTAVYVLCRITGMKSECAEIVAYASQYVDDAVHASTLKFKNGGIFKQTMTAHKHLIPRDYNMNEAIDVWIPFHFPPRGDRTDANPMVTAPYSKVLGLLLEDVRACSSSQTLYRLGIGLHYLADAYSHADFKGLYDVHNDVQLLTGLSEKGFLEDAGRRLTNKLMERWSADSNAIGHLEVLQNPDIPYVQWSYARAGKIYQVNNLEDRYLPAIRKMHEYLVYYLNRNHTFRSNTPCRSFEDYEEKFKVVLSHKGAKEERHKNWLKAIKSNYFEFSDYDDRDKTVFYDENAWFAEAVETSKVTRNRYRQLHQDVYKKRTRFDESNWVKYMQAAAEHRFLVIHCLLPELGIIMG